MVSRKSKSMPMCTFAVDLAQRDLAQRQFITIPASIKLYATLGKGMASVIDQTVLSDQSVVDSLSGGGHMAS